MKKKSIIGISIAVAAALGMAAILAFVLGGSKKGAAKIPTKGYQFTTVSTGSIEKTVSSSGTLSPKSQVSVISQMSGIVTKVNADYNDKVRKGQVLAELDTSMLRLELQQQKAQVTKGQASFDMKKIDFDNAEALAAKGLVSEYELKAARANLDVARSELEAAKASYDVTRTKISDYALIKSPIDGIVLDRNADVGQNVVEGSSSNSTAVFKVAKDLSTMEIEATVDELDIAGIAKGMPVRFTVEALPGKSMDGSVSSIRLIPSTTNNVVSYTVIVSADNATGKLLPGMTAQIEFIESTKKDVLTVGAAALRFSPATLSPEQIARKVFEARLPADMGAEERAKAIAAFEKRRAEAAKSAEPSASNGQTGLSGLVMGGPRPGGNWNRNRNRNQSSTRSAQGGAPSGGPGTAGTGAPSGGGGPSASGQRDQAAAGAQGSGDETIDPSSLKTLWYLDDSGQLQVMLVQAGVSDGSKTEIKVPESMKAKLNGKKVILKEKL